jgi:hypothetical protein
MCGLHKCKVMHAMVTTTTHYCCKNLFGHLWSRVWIFVKPCMQHYSKIRWFVPASPWSYIVRIGSSWYLTKKFPKLDRVALSKHSKLEHKKHRTYISYRLWWDNIIKPSKVEFVTHRQPQLAHVMLSCTWHKMATSTTTTCWAWHIIKAKGIYCGCCSMGSLDECMGQFVLSDGRKA